MKARVFTESQRALLIEAAESPAGWYIHVRKGNHSTYYGPFKTHLQGLVYKAASMPAHDAKNMSGGGQELHYGSGVYEYDRGEVSGSIEFADEGETGSIEPPSKIKVHPSWAREASAVKRQSPLHTAAMVALYYSKHHGESSRVPSDADIEKAIKGRL